MIELRVQITAYNKDWNTCKAKLMDGREIDLDPFVGCAIRLTDDEYEAGKGFDLVGKTYILTSYSVHPNNVLPHEGGMIEV